MKITRRDLGVLLIIAGILIAFLSYKMSFEGTMEEIETIQNEQDTLKKQIDALKPLVTESKKWDDDRKAMASLLNKMIKEFDVDVWQEDNIMSVVDIEDKLNVKVPSFSAQPATEVSRVDGKGHFAGQIYVLSKATTTLSYQAEEYPDLKELIKHVYSNDKAKRLIDNISMSFDVETGNINGNATVFEYVMNDKDREYEPVELPDDNYGIENENYNSIFGETETAEEEENNNESEY